MAQLAVSVAGAIAGGVAGFFIGGPAGAAYGAELGFALGGIVGGMLVHQKGPQPNDLRIQDSAYGKPIPVLYGMYRAAGNVIWAGQPVSDDGGGKGSPPSGAKVSMSFAIGICEGPINSVRRIWANGKLIYDISNPSNFQALSGSSQMTTNFVLYVGDENQTPDPTMEAALGAGNVPAHRGLAYVVFNGLDLSPWGNYLPSFAFEVIANGAAATFTDYFGGSYTHQTTLGTMMQCSRLTATGGNVTAFGYYTGYDGWYSADISAYGSATVATVAPPTAPTLTSFVANGNSDEDGIWTDTASGPAWFLNDGGAPVVTMTGLVGTGISPSNQQTSFWKNGTDFFVCSAYGGAARPVYRVDFVAGGLLATSAITAPFVVIGGSAHYVYVADTTHNTIYQLDRLTLAVVNSWVNSAFNGVSLGYVVSDSAIYLVIANIPLGLHLFNPTNGALTRLGTPPFQPKSMAVINPTYIVFSDWESVATVRIAYMTESIGQTDALLADIVADICTRAGLSSSQYDVSQLTDRVTGYAITNHSAARANLAPLMSTYFFDACDTDGLIKFVKRGGNPIAAISYGDLGASSSVGDTTNENPVTEQIAQEVDLPRTVSFTYSGLNNDYQANTQRAFRANTSSNKDVAVSAPIVLSDDQGLTRAQAMLWAAWVGRKSFTFSTPLNYLQYEPGDVLTLPGDAGQAYTIRIVRCQYDGQGALVWTATLEDPNIYPGPTYNAQGGAPSGFTPQTMDYSGPTALAVLDVPPLRNTDTTPGLYIAACGYAANWPGVMVDISRDGNSYTDLFRILNASPIGYASSVLPTFGGGNQPDELSTVTVVLYSGTLASVGYSDFMTGLNAAYIGGELVFFRNATLIAANTYQLSGFLRGRVGTEAAMTTHAINEQFVFLDPTKIVSAGVNLSDIGAQLYFEPHLLNLFANQPVTPTTLTPASARVRPLSPALFVAGPGSAASTSDISLSWFRRARINADWRDGADVALDESAETYTLKVYNGSTLVRTVTVSAATAYVYSAANIAADGFTTGNVITFTAQQNSDQGVLGSAAMTTITR